MSEKTSINPSDIPVRSQSSINQGVRYRTISNIKNAGYLVLGYVSKVFYKKGTLDYSLNGTTNYNSLEDISGTGSAPIPVDFWGYNSDGKPFGHYRVVKEGDKVLLGFVNGNTGNPIVVGIYPSDQSSYELISPVDFSDADDSTERIQDQVLGDKKVYSNQQIFYRSGSGDLLRTLNGNSFLEIKDTENIDYLSDIWHTYDSLQDVYLSDGTEVEPQSGKAPAWLLVHEDNPNYENNDNHLTRFYVNNAGKFQAVFTNISDTNQPTLIIEGSKDKGFTLTKRFDNSNLDEDSTDYVTLNLGDSSTKSFAVTASTETDSETQSSKLEVKPDGVYVDGKSLLDYIDSAISVTVEDIDKVLPDSTYFQQLQEATTSAGNQAESAAEQAAQAGEDAKDAGAKAEQAGEDAKASAADIKNRIIYYTSISPEKDVYVPGKYLIINTDTYIADGTIKNAYIEDATIDQAKIAQEAVGEAQIEDLAVTRAKLANLAVGTAQIEDLAVTDEKVGELSFYHMIGSILDADQINVVNLHGDNIKAGTITADRLIINGLGDITSNLGTITSGKIIAGDGTTGVNVSGLDADNPDEYTPYKKSLLKAQIAVLEAQANAAISYAKDTGNDSSNVSSALSALLNGTADLLSDMAVTTEFDSTEIETWETNLQTAISNFQTTVNSDLNRQIGNTADGKNKVTYGTQQPEDPIDGDIWVEVNADGTSQIKVYTSDSGWVNPVDANVNAVAQQVANLPKNYYSSDQPSGTDFTDGSHWYEQTGTDSNGNPIYTVHLWSSSTKTWNKMLNSGEVDNANQISQVKSDLTQAQSDIATAKTNITSVQSDLATAKTNITNNANAIRDAQGNISSLQSSASKLESDMTDAKGNISTLQQDSTSFKSEIGNLQSDNSTNKSNISSLQQTASGLTSTVASVQTQVNNISTGGFNILERTGMDDSSSLNISDNVGSGVTTVSRISDATSPTGYAFTITRTDSNTGNNGGRYWNTPQTLTSGKQYSWTVWAKGTGTWIVGHEQGGQMSITLTDDYVKYTKTFTANSNKYYQFIMYTTDSGVSLTALPIMLIEGTVPSAWGRSINDVATVTSVSTLSNTVDGLSNTVSDNSGNITTLQTRANGFDVSIGQLQTSVNSLGQVNLVPNGGFISGIDGWVPIGNPNIDYSDMTSDTINGHHSLRLMTAGNTSPVWYGAASPRFAVKDNNTISYQAWVMVWELPDSGQKFDLQIEWFNDGVNGTGTRTGFSAPSSTTIDSKGSWVNIKAEGIQPPSGTTAARLVLYCSQNGSASMTQVMATPGSTIGEYVDNISDMLTQSGNYAGLSINSNGLTQVAGSTSVYLSNTHGFEIQKSGSDIFHVDTSGNLTMQGNITAGNISGVNFTGDNLTLAGSMAVTGSISADNGNVVINSSGLTIRGNTSNVGIYVGASGSTDNPSGTHTYIRSDGTFATTSGTFSGSVAITDSLTLSGSSANIDVGGGKFHVDASGNVTAKSMTTTNGVFNSGTISDSSIQMNPEYFSYLNNSDEYSTNISSKGLSGGFQYSNNASDWETYMDQSKPYNIGTGNSVTNKTSSPVNNACTKNFVYINGASFSDGDSILIDVEINYANAGYIPGCTVYMQTDGSTTSDRRYHASNEKYSCMTGDYRYKFTIEYQSSWGTGSIGFQLRFDNLQASSDAYIISIRPSINSASNNSSSSSNIYEESVGISSMGVLYGHSYIKTSDFGDIMYSSMEWSDGLLRLTEGGNYGESTPFVETDISAYGIAIFGDSNGKSALDFFGDVSHETVMGNQDATPYESDLDSRFLTVRSDYANGMYFDKYGNIHGYKKSTTFNIYGNTGKKVLQLPFKNGGGDAILGDSSGNNNVGLWGPVLYWDTKYGGTRLLYADSSQFHVTSSRFIGGGVELLGNNCAQATSGGDFYLNGAGGSGGNAVLHVKSVSQSSLLSKKTNISKVDPATALDKINQTNIYDYQFKTDVANGSTKHYASFIIDDVNDVSQYTEPSEFLSEDKKGRDDGTQLAYLTAAVQYLAQKVKELESK